VVRPITNCDSGPEGAVNYASIHGKVGFYWNNFPLAKNDYNFTCPEEYYKCYRLVGGR